MPQQRKRPTKNVIHFCAWMVRYTFQQPVKRRVWDIVCSDVCLPRDPDGRTRKQVLASHKLSSFQAHTMPDMNCCIYKPFIVSTCGSTPSICFMF
mmetsp:Transcript_27940/g.75490  ORF Transcript_27940/g.75490 Transcript_27940/m.75490 type:complete len:95 (+) Transcript_27940:1287-1571(+)